MRAQPPAVTTTDLEPLYDEDDAAAAVSLFRSVEYGNTPRSAMPRRDLPRCRSYLGSAIIVLDVQHGDGPARRIVFSGEPRPAQHAHHR